MGNGAQVTELDILNHVVAPGQPGLSPEAAKSLLIMTFDQEAKERIGELLTRNQVGNLPEAELDELHRYLRVGQLLDLLHAKARLALQP